jgi:hypothetical protein
LTWPDSLASSVRDSVNKYDVTRGRESEKM